MITMIHKYQVLKKLKIPVKAELLTAAVSLEVVSLPLRLRLTESESEPADELTVAVTGKVWSAVAACTFPVKIMIFEVWALMVPRLMPEPMFPADAAPSMVKFPV